MKKFLFCFALSIALLDAGAQTVASKMRVAFQKFGADPQLSNAVVGLYVINAKSGKVVFEHNARVGLAPASTQKVITAATAFALLGKDYRYHTTLAYTGQPGTGEKGNLYLQGSGDPTLGSWRWKSTGEEAVMNRFMNAIRKAGIREYNALHIEAKGWEGEAVPDGWIWQDIGNYYGAGADVLNWRENQYDLIMKSGSGLGEDVMITGTKPSLYNYSFDSYVTAAAKGTGDRTYIYFPATGGKGMVRGTIPVNENAFVVSGAMPSGRAQLIATLTDSLNKAGIRGQQAAVVRDRRYITGDQELLTTLHIEQSPALDSISYWFLRRSINHYGEALVKTFAREKALEATTANGVKVLVDFWKANGIAATELNMSDGSGLSPLNRVTAQAQVQVLQFARRQSWFNEFYEGMPSFNGMRMKSGTISDVKGFCGYHTAASGEQYIYSFIVNNYNGGSGALVQKMYAVLDVLK